MRAIIRKPRDDLHSHKLIVDFWSPMYGYCTAYGNPLIQQPLKRVLFERKIALDN